MYYTKEQLHNNYYVEDHKILLNIYLFDRSQELIYVDTYDVSISARSWSKVLSHDNTIDSMIYGMEMRNRKINETRLYSEIVKSA